MGNDQSKRDEREDQPQSASQVPRSLPDISTRPVKELVSRALPVDRGWYETPDTPTSDVSFTDSDFERDDSVTQGAARLRSHDPHSSYVVDEGPDEAASSQTLQQLLQRFVHGPDSMQLLVGYLEFPCIEKVTVLAKCVGFESCTFDVPYVQLHRFPVEEETDAEMRSVMGHQLLSRHAQKISEMELLSLDRAMEESLELHLKQALHSKRSTENWNSAVLVEYDVQAFLLALETVKEIFQKVATECHVTVQMSQQHRIALTAGEGETALKVEKTIQKGELVWRRLQHWSTNVRKEKKFNIWAKGLDAAVKERILEIALEIGFETAVVQQNGNIHLEIKPPEGQHRRKLKHATDELRMELEPIDDAVCQNVEQHLKEWLSEFHRSGKQKDVLNCRFVLPAEWLRHTSERLAAQYSVSVKMETGIELLFYRSDVDPSSIQESVAPKDPSLTASTTSAASTSKKAKSKNRTKKKSPESSVTLEPSLSNGQPSDPPLMPCDPRTGNDPMNRTTSSSSSNALALGNARRTSSRNKYDYGWDPSWPTAHPDRAATSQHTY